MDKVLQARCRKKSQAPSSVVVPNDSSLVGGNVNDQMQNDGPKPYLLRTRSTMQFISGNIPPFDIVALLNEEQNGLKEIMISKILDEY